MKSKNIFKIFIVAFLISNVFVNIKVYQSSYFQAFLLYDFNNDSYRLPYEIYSKVDYNFPNLTQTALPIKLLKARYLLNLDSVSQAKTLLLDARRANPYIMAPEDMLAKINLQENNLDSAYLLSKLAFNKMPNVDLHRNTYFKVLRSLKDSINVESELDNAFMRLKNLRASQNHWYDYIFSKSIITDSIATVIPLINQFKERFPNEDTKIIEELENRIEIGTGSYTLFSFFSAIGDDYFKNEDYLNSSNYYEKAIDYNQDNYVIYENLAISYDLSNRTDKALEIYDFVLNNFKPNNGRAEFYKGLLLVRLGENELGCNYLRESSNKNYVGSNTKIRASEVFIGLCVNN
jgi:tetratricopeptide (TPR) repeat protein